MAGFVIDLKTYDRRIVFISQSCIRISMFHQVAEISFLCGNRFRIRMHIAFIIETAGLYIPFGVSVSEVSLCGDDNMDIALLKFGN